MITVTTPVPAECAELRARAATLGRSIQALPRAVSRAQAELRRAAPGEKAELLAEIRELKSSLQRATEERAAVLARMRELGCP